MGRAIMIIGAGALAVGVIIYALIECAQSQRYDVRALPKWAWVLVILLLPVIGAILWLAISSVPQPLDLWSAGRTTLKTREVSRSMPSGSPDR